MRESRKNHDLVEISKHVYYEVNHFIGLAILVISPGERKNRIINNALFESLVIHGRNLFYFLFPDNPRNDDVIIYDFIGASLEWDRYKEMETQSDVLVSFKSRIAKEIVHLTYPRLEKTSENKNWDLDFIESIIKGTDKFLQLVPEDLLHSDWCEYEQLKKKYYETRYQSPFKILAYGTH